MHTPLPFKKSNRAFRRRQTVISLSLVVFIPFFFFAAFLRANNYNGMPDQAFSPESNAPAYEHGSSTDSGFISAGKDTLVKTTGEIVPLDCPPNIAGSFTAVGHVSCYGGDDGFATVRATGGSGTFDFLWSDGQTTATASNLTAGEYSVTITDAFILNSISVSIEITEPTLLVAEVVAVSDETAEGASDGFAEVEATGGTPPYSYLWSDGQTTETATDLAAGTYFVTVTDDNDCSVQLSVTVNLLAEIQASIIASTNVSCNGGNDGSAEVLATGGTGSYIYLWSDGQTTAIASDLSAGEYSVTVTDDIGFYYATATVTITEPLLLTAEIIYYQNISCYSLEDGVASVSANGGNTPYSYMWSESADSQTSVIATGLAPGSHTVTVTDANGCEATATAEIEDAVPLSASASVIQHAGCHGEATGSATVTPEGGLPPYTFLWDNGATDQTAIHLAAGTYLVTVFDKNGCSAMAEVSISQPDEPLAVSVINTVNPPCEGSSMGSIAAEATGGTPPYTYLWNNGQSASEATELPAGTYVITVTDANGCTGSATALLTDPAGITATIVEWTNVSCNGESDGQATVSASGGSGSYSYLWNTIPEQTTATATNLSAGQYTVTITDSDGCNAATVANITEPTVLTANIISKENVSCLGGNDGSATVSATGGTPPYTYLWDTDPAQTGITATGLAYGTYMVEVSDANSCKITAEVSIEEPEEAIQASHSITHIKCHGAATGSITVTPQGGTPPYGYLWSNGSTDQTNTGLAAGIYSVVITDKYGCSFSIDDLEVTQPDEGIEATASVEHVLCHGGSTGAIYLEVAGGVPPYSYEWSNGAITKDISNIPAGHYQVKITDANGCSVSLQREVLQPTLLIAEIISSNDVSCFEGNDGSATVNATGGTTPYSYEWNTIPPQTTSTASGLAAGSYQVKVTDVNGCEAFTEVTVGQPEEALQASFGVEHVACHGEATGSATVTPQGGTTPYSYLWSNGSTDQTNRGLAAGIYSVVITDDNGCSFSVDNIEVDQPEEMLKAVSSVEHLRCAGSDTGSIFLDVTGGVPPYSFKWSNGATSQNLVDVPAGFYQVVITDDNGCSITLQREILKPTLLIAEIISSSDVSCFGGGDGRATVNATGGTTPYTYEWNTVPVQTTAIATGLAAGTYIVVVTDANGCTAEASVAIEQSEEALQASYEVVHVACHGAATGSIAVTPQGGTPPYRFLWSNGSTDQINTGLTAGIYSVTVTDEKGCALTMADVEVTQPDEAVKVIATVNDVLCFGGHTGSIYLEITGGMPPFTFWWSDGSTAQDLVNVAAGNYQVEVTDNNGCSVTLQLEIIQPPDLLVFDVITEDLLCKEDSLGSISFSITGGVPPYTYLWSNGLTTRNFTKMPGGVYQLTITDSNGCVHSYEYEIKYQEEDCELRVPEGISMDGDGINDIWKINGLQRYPNNMVQVYNRWGTLVYESSPYKNDWDGTPNRGRILTESDGKLPTGTYYWILKPDPDLSPLSGYIYLIR